MISQSEYIEHLKKIRQIKSTRGNIKTISRLDKCHKDARKLRKISYNFIKKREFFYGKSVIFVLFIPFLVDFGAFFGVLE
jgi:hypothetical protein